MDSATILIVEDERIVAADLANRLKRMGYTVAGIASCSDQALEMAGHLDSGLVLMDIQIKGDMDGIETAQAIQASHNLPIIYLTAHSDPATFARAKLTGPVGYIVKPFEERDLAVQIELALHKHTIDCRLHESEERYRSLFQNNHAVMMLIDPQTGRIVDANPAACAYYGYSLSELTAFLISDINVKTKGDVHQQMQMAIDREKRQFFFKHRLANGLVRDVEVFSGPIEIDSQKLLYSIVHDITARRYAEDALQRMNETLEQQVVERTRLAEKRAAHLQTLAVELIRAEERERQRIAQLLHDDLQQILAATKLQLEGLCEQIPEEPILKQVNQWIIEAVDKTRTLSHELSPAALQAASLQAGLEWIVKRMQKQFGLTVTLDIRSARSVEDELLKVFLLRGVREFLFNVVKHAGVDTANHTMLNLKKPSMPVQFPNAAIGWKAAHLTEPLSAFF